jgi:hypothetical protein
MSYARRDDGSREQAPAIQVHANSTNFKEPHQAGLIEEPSMLREYVAAILKATHDRMKWRGF